MCEQALPWEERLWHRCRATEGTHADAADAAAAQAAGALRRLGAPVLVVQGQGLRPGAVVGSGVRISRQRLCKQGGIARHLKGKCTKMKEARSQPALLPERAPGFLLSHFWNGTRIYLFMYLFIYYITWVRCF